MFVKTVTTIARFPLLVLPLALAATVNCGGGGSDSGKGGSGGSGTAGTTGSGGTTGTGGTGTGGTGPTTKNCTVQPATAADMTILDFNAVAAGSTQATFGGYMEGMQYGGGTYIYPNAMLAADQMGLSNTFDGMNWHITGLVKDYAGFGLYLTSVSDLSMFGGMSFDISGTFTAAGAGAAPAATATMSISDVAHSVDSLHTADGSMTCGTCAPTASQYDGTCASPTKVITLTGTATPTTVRWNDLTGGKRPPSFTGESPNPANIIAIAWALPWNGAGSATYTVDIVIDNFKYITP